MKIALNCWILRNKDTDGIGRFTIETFRLLIRNHPEIEFLILCDKQFSEDYFDFPNTKKYPVFPALRHPVLYLYYMEVVVSQFLACHKPALFVSPDGMLSLSSKHKQLIVLHDLNFEHAPQDLVFRNRIYYRSMFSKFARKAARIVTISEYSKKDIIELYQVAPGKIDVIPLGSNTIFSPVDENQAKAVRDKYAAGEAYFFFVGSMHPRKNINRLMQAFDAFKDQTGSKMKLLLVGHIMWDEKSIQEIYKTLRNKSDIVFTGRVNDAELALITGAAYCLTFVPTFEGFGLPIVEAFASNIPVICSKLTSMPEVSGDAALLVDPFNVSDITSAMVTIVADKDLRQDLIRRGAQRQLLFTWDKTAGLLYQSILKAIR